MSKYQPRKKNLTPKQAREEWEGFFDTFMTNADVDTAEPPEARAKRRADLERDPEQWFRYYFDSFHRWTSASYIKHRCLFSPKGGCRTTAPAFFCASSAPAPTQSRASRRC